MPADMRRYPPNWATEIRPRILERAGGRCERCGVRNHAIGHRDAGGHFEACTPCETTTAPLDCPNGRTIRIVLTIAHTLNPDPMDCRDENLEALCQRCHNLLDGPMRQANAAATRRRRRIDAGQVELL